MSEHEHGQHAKQKITLKLSRPMLLKIGAAVIVVLLSPIAATAMDLYAFHWHNPTLLKIAKALPFTALSVGGERYTVSEYEVELANLDRILKGSGKTTSRPDLQKMLVDRLTRAAAVKSLVEERKIDETQAVAIAKSLTFGEEMSDEEIEKAVKENFNWSMEYFNSHVLTPFGREMALALTILKPQADAIAAEVKAPGADFAKIAKAKGEDATKDKGGDLGYFKKGMMVPEFEREVFAMKKGEIAGPFASRFGWHIVKVVDVKDEGAEQQIKASHIIVNLQNHQDDIEPVIVEAQKNVIVSVLVKE